MITANHWTISTVQPECSGHSDIFQLRTGGEAELAASTASTSLSFVFYMSNIWLASDMHAGIHAFIYS